MARPSSDGRIARRSGFAASAIRYYEAEGLIEAHRSGGGQRRFERNVLRRLAFIRAAFNVGLTIEEIRDDFARLPDSPTPTKADWQRISRHWGQRLDEQIAALQRLKGGLDSCIGCGCLSLRSCSSPTPTTSTPTAGRARGCCPTPCGGRTRLGGPRTDRSVCLTGNAHSAAGRTRRPHTEGVGTHSRGGHMPRLEPPDENTTMTPSHDPNAVADVVDLPTTAPHTGQEAPSSSAARMLEVAARTADRLVTEAEKDAESLLATAQAAADEIAEASRNERAGVLDRLAEEKAELEAQIATLRETETEQRRQMRSHLTEQLALLDATTLEQPTDGAD